MTRNMKKFSSNKNGEQMAKVKCMSLKQQICLEGQVVEEEQKVRGEYKRREANIKKGLERMCQISVKVGGLIRRRGQCLWMSMSMLVLYCFSIVATLQVSSGRADNKG